MEQDENKEHHQNDTEKDVIADYYQDHQQFELQSAETQVKRARNVLFLVAGLSLVYNLVQLGQQGTLSGLPLIITLAISILFAGLGLLTKKQPFGAIIAGLIIYVGLWIADIIVVGTDNLMQGILVRGIIVYILIRGLKPAREAERLRKEIKSEE